MDTKHITTRAVLKDGEGEEGIIEAVFSTFDVVDRDGDIVVREAIEDGKEIAMTWAHDWSRIIGKGSTHVEDDRAVFKGRFFLDTADGLDAYRTVKNMGSLQEYSWGFRVTDSDFVERDGQQVRVIKGTEQFEMSPVLIGAAGTGRTGTLSLKHGQPLYDHADALEDAVVDFVSRVRGRAEYRAKEGRTLSSANRDRLSSIASALSGAAGDLNAILKEIEPAKGIDIDALFAEHMAVQAQLNGVPIS